MFFIVLWWRLQRVVHVKYLAQGLAQNKHSVKVVTIIGSVNKYASSVKYWLAVHLFDIFPKDSARVAKNDLTKYIYVDFRIW